MRLGGHCAPQANTSKVIKLLQFIKSVIILTLNLVYIYLCAFSSCSPSLFLYRQLTINLQLLIILVHRAQPILPILLKQAAVRMFLLSFQVLVYSLLIVVELNLIVDQLLVFVGLQAIELKVEVETRHRLPHWLIIRHMQLLHVGVRECLLDRYTLRRVKHQHLLHEVDRIAVRVTFKELVEVGSLAFRQLPHEFLVVFILDLVDQVLTWRTDQLCYHMHHLLLTLRWQQHLTPH